MADFMTTATAQFLPATALDIDHPVPGVYVGVPFDIYVRVRAANHSALKKFRQSPLHVWTAYNEPQSPEQALGEAAHCWMLERPSFWDRYAIYDERTENGNLRPRNGEHWKAWKAANPGKKDITKDGVLEVQAMSRGVGLHPRAEHLRRAVGHVESVMVWMDPSGVLCKARIDKLIPAETTVLLDVKSTENACTKKFSRSIENYGYDTQGAMYERGWKVLVGTPVRFVILPIESSPPYAARALDLGPRTRKNAAEIVNGWLLQYAACQKVGAWSGYDDGIETIDISDYALRGVEEDEE